MEANVAFCFSRALLVDPTHSSHDSNNDSNHESNHDSNHASKDETLHDVKSVRFPPNPISNSISISISNSSSTLDKNDDGDKNDDNDKNDENDYNSDFYVEDIAQIPSLMVQNLVESFHCLVEARIHAFLTVLLAHAKHHHHNHHSNHHTNDKNYSNDSNELIWQKMTGLEHVRNHLNVDTAVTSFQLQPDHNINDNNDNNDNTKQGVYKVNVNVNFTAVMDVRFTEGGPLVTVSFNAPGSLIGTSIFLYFIYFIYFILYYIIYYISFMSVC